MNYNIIAENEEYTVVSEYETQYGAPDQYQSEAALERDFIKTLTEQGYEQAAAGNVVLDAVFHQVENNLVQVIFQNQHRAVLLQFHMNGNVRLTCHGQQHAMDTVDRGCHVDNLAFFLPLAVYLGQGKKLLRHAV